MTWEIRKVEEDSSDVDMLLLDGWEPFAVHAQADEVEVDDYRSMEVERVYLWLRRQVPMAVRPRRGRANR